MTHFKLIAGPCLIEDEETTLRIAAHCKEIADRLNLEYYFKGSYKKANRTKISSVSSKLSEQQALNVLHRIRTVMGIPTITDVHETHDCETVSKYVDVIQIPAFLCRQTELLIAAGNTGKIVNIKKGQFMSPESMRHAQDKVLSASETVSNIWLTERGTTFGYDYLMVDMTSMPKMRKFNDNVIMDCTHSVQRPNQTDGTGGDPEMIETIALSSIAAGATGLFLEVHPHPHLSSSDSTNILQIDKLEGILEKCIRIKQAIS